MGIYDRDYVRNRGGGGGFGGFGGGRFGAGRSWIWPLIIANVIAFLLDPMLAPRFGYPPLLMWGHFSETTAISHLQLWRFISFQFLHGGLQHIFFNMLALYMFGPMVESYLGSRRFLAFYLICGVAGPLAYLLLLWGNIMLANPDTPMVGASAGIFGILIAAARIAPDTRVMLLFPPIPMKLKVLTWIFIGIAAFTVLSQGPNAGGEAAHLGGAAAGFLLIRKPGLLNFVLGSGTRRHQF